MLLPSLLTLWSFLLWFFHTFLAVPAVIGVPAVFGFSSVLASLLLLAFLLLLVYLQLLVILLLLSTALAAVLKNLTFFNYWTIGLLLSDSNFSVSGLSIIGLLT